MSSCGPFRRRTVSPFIFTFVVSRPAVRKNLWLRLLAVGSRLKASRAPALGPVLPRPVTLVESGGERERGRRGASASQTATVGSSSLVTFSTCVSGVSFVTPLVGFPCSPSFRGLCGEMSRRCPAAECEAVVNWDSVPAGGGLFLATGQTTKASQSTRERENERETYAAIVNNVGGG